MMLCPHFFFIFQLVLTQLQVEFGEFESICAQRHLWFGMINSTGQPKAEAFGGGRATVTGVGAGGGRFSMTGVGARWGMFRKGSG